MTYKLVEMMETDHLLREHTANLDRMLTLVAEELHEDAVRGVARDPDMSSEVIALHERVERLEFALSMTMASLSRTHEVLIGLLQDLCEEEDHRPEMSH